MQSRNAVLKPGACRAFAVLALCLVPLLTRAEDAPRLPPTPEILPDGTVMYAEISPWKEWSQDFSKTSLNQIFSEPELRQFLAGPFSQVSALIRRATAAAEANPDQAKALQTATQTANAISNGLEVLSEVVPGPFVLAVRFSTEDAQAKRPPAVAVVAGLTDDKELEAKSNVVAGVVGGFLKEKNVQVITVTDYQNAKVVTIGSPQSSISFTISKGRLILSNEIRFCTQILDGMSGTQAKKLSDSTTFKNTGLAGNEHLIAYLDIAGLKTAFGAMEAPEARNQLDEFFTMAGLNKSTAVAWSMKMRGAAFESRTAIFSNQREGLLGTLDEEPVTMDALKACPQGSPLAAGFRIKQEKLLPFIRNAVRSLQGNKGIENFDALEKQVNGEPGRNLERELREAFGNELVICSLATGDDSGTINAISALSGSISVKDMKKAEELLDLVLTRVAARSDPGGEPSEVLKEVEFDGTKIRYLKGRTLGGVLEISPAFALRQNRLLFALDVPMLKRAMNVLKSGKSLDTSDAFKMALAETGGKMGPIFSYVDWAFVYRSAFTLGTTALKLIAPTDVLKEIGVDLNLLPTAETVSQHLFPGLSVAQLSPNGIVLTSRSPLPSVEVVSPPLAAVSAVFATFRPFLLAPEKGK